MTEYLRVEYQEICQMGGRDKAVVFKLLMNKLQVGHRGKIPGFTICWGLFPTGETVVKPCLFGWAYYTQFFHSSFQRGRFYV
jgi:hypothetical protein